MRSADVSLPDRVDASTSGDVRYTLQVAIDASAEPDVVVDCRALDVVDVAGLGVLMGAHRRAKASGRRLVLAEPSPRMLRLLAITRLHRILHVQRSLPGASRQAAAVAAS